MQLSINVFHLCLFWSSDVAEFYVVNAIYHAIIPALCASIAEDIDGIMLINWVKNVNRQDFMIYEQ